MHFRDALSSSTTVTVTVRAFARYAEILGLEETTLELDEPATVSDAVKLLRSSIPNGSRLPERPLVAINREHVLAETPLQDGDELALLPPLAGG
ncbi:MAG: MoaD/ThiS family protein [Gemmatimonadetes bacterium]|nr:MoaD/ThiS family protein [Gemmatimonadota bacterium]